MGGFGFAPMVRPTAAPEEGEDARAEYAGLDDQHAMHKAAFLGDVVEARRIAGEHPRVAPDAGSMDGADATAQPSFFERRSDGNGMTPLIIASARGHLGFVKFLVEEEEVDRQRTSEKTLITPFFAACSNGRIDVAKYLASKARSSLPPSHPGARARRASPPPPTRARDGLLDSPARSQGVDVSRASADGTTPANAAVCAGHMSVLKLLNSKGANLGAKNAANGVTPLYTAAWRNNLEMARFLLELDEDHGVDVNARAHDGGTPLFVACFKGEPATRARPRGDRATAAEGPSRARAQVTRRWPSCCSRTARTPRSRASRRRETNR